MEREVSLVRTDRFYVRQISALVMEIVGVLVFLFRIPDLHSEAGDLLA